MVTHSAFSTATSLDFVNSLWNSDGARRRFEQDVNFKLSSGLEGSAFEQGLEGKSDDYMDEFVVWSIRHLGLEQVMPVLLLDRSTTAGLAN